MATFTSGWLAKLLGVLWQDGSGTNIGRTDVVKLGDGILATWDNGELLIEANSGFTIAETSSDVTVTAGAGDTTLFDYDLSAIETEGVGIVDGQSLLIDVRVEAWRTADVDVAGYCDLTAHVVYHTAGSGGSEILNDPTVEQIVSSSWEAGLSVDVEIVSNTTLRVKANSSTTTVRANVLLSHRPPRTRSAS